MRGRILAGALLLGLMAPAPPAAVAAACEGASCGVPKCWNPVVHARPGMAREVQVSCWNVVRAELAQGPAHGTVTDLEPRWGIRFVIRPDEDAPREDRVVVRLIGHEGTVEQPVDIVIKPLAENSAPVCHGDRKSERSSGLVPVELHLGPYCSDPDQDDFVMHGGGPGVHPEDPKKVRSGDSESNWTYRTATHSGKETATVWAVDSLGARSQDALLEVEVGPGIDRLPECAPLGVDVIPVHVRPGVPRRYGIVCNDLDGDPLVAHVTDPPDRSTMTFVPTQSNSGSYWGFEQWHAVTYVPHDAAELPDDFTLRATGLAGAGPSARWAFVPRPYPANGGGGCGWSPVYVTTGTAGAVGVECSDDEGDPLTATVVDGPLHGIAGPPVVVEGLYGQQTITVPYLPAPGHVGWDCVKVRITDGVGIAWTISVDVYTVEPAALPELPAMPDLPAVPLPLPLPGWTPPAGAPIGPAALRPPERVDPALAARYAAGVLSAAGVTRLPAPDEALLYAAKALRRADLLRSDKAPAMLALCPRGCRIRVGSRLIGAGRARRTRNAWRRTAAVGAPGQSQLLWLDLDAAQRARLRRARRPRAQFEVSLRAPGLAPRTARVTIPITTTR